MDEYRAFDATRELSNFVDGLSNWYLRRSRQRFWKSEKDDDKLDAYATLYETLVTVTKLVAPFLPFMSEELYQNLVRPWGENAPESVHLSDYPEPDASRINASLNEEMATVRSVVSLGLRVRTDHKLKVRQPLSKAEVVLSNPELEDRVSRYKELMMEELNVHDFEFYRGAEQHVIYSVKPNFRRLGPRLGKKMPLLKKALHKADGAALRQSLTDTGRVEIPLDGEAFVLDMEDVEVTVQSKEGYAAAGDQVAVVVLTTALTPELVDEGLYRELLSRIQALRKELELEYTQRIRLAIQGSPPLQSIVEARREHFMGEVLCVELSEEPGDWDDVATRDMEVEGEEVRITLAGS
jgi:isoleucyl-tRNA synthetase